MVAFTSDLPAFGWDVDVLTVTARAFPDTTGERLADIPATSRVIRACGLDTARHLSICGKYPRLLSLPDRWVSWRVGAIVSGLYHIRKHRPNAIMSSFPIATAHLIAYDLHRLTGLPWVADFRDPMAQDEYPKTQAEWNCYRRIEEQTVTHAAACTFTAPSALEYYRKRYGDGLAATSHIIPNGFDEQVFAELEDMPRAGRTAGSPLTFLHSGLLYPWERDPVPFFCALKTLKANGFWRRHPSRFVFRASGFDAHFAHIVRALGVEDLVEFRPRIDYRSAVREIMDADALLLFQAANSNFQIPAKTYEYLRAGRPVLAVVDPGGDTAALVHQHDGNVVVDIDAEDAIRCGLERMLGLLSETPPAVGNRVDTRKYSRIESARALAGVLDALT